MDYRALISRTYKSAFRTLLFFLLLAIVASVYVVTTYGLHGSVKQYILDLASSGDYVMKAERIRIGFGEGLIFNKARIYRKGVVGDPAMDARVVTLALDPWALLKGRFVINGIKLDSLVVRTDNLSRKQSAGGSSPMNWNQGFSIEVNEGSAMGMNIAKLKMNIVGEGHTLSVRDIDCHLADLETARTGYFTGNMRFDSITGVTSGNIRSHLDPHILIPLIRVGGLDFTETLTRRFVFEHGIPDIEVSFANLSGPSGYFKLNGRFEADTFSYQGVPVQRTDGKIGIEYSETKSEVVLDPLVISRKEGIVSGGITVDTGAGMVKFKAMSSIDPKSLFKLIGLFSDSEMSYFRFDGPVNIIAEGGVDYGTMTNTFFAADVSTRGMAISKFRSDECTFKMKMVGLTNEVYDIKASLCSGSLKGKASFFVPEQENARIKYDISGSTADISSDELQNMLLGISDAGNRGRVAADFSLQGEIGEGTSKSIKGTGSVHVKAGKVYRLPIFGPLSGYMSRIIPGFDFVLGQTDAKGSFVIADGKVASEDIYIGGDVMSIKGKGSCSFNGELDYYAQVTLMQESTLLAKLLRTLTYPISKLFEFRVKGTYDEPKWYPVNFSGDLLERIGLKEEKKEGAAK